MDTTQLGWLLLGLAMGGNLALAWRLGRTVKNRIVVFAIYSGVLGGLWIIIDLIFAGVTSLLPLPALLEAWRWLAVGLGLFWLAAIGLAFLRLRRYEA